MTKDDTVILESFAEKDDPRNDWIKDLTEARLSYRVKLSYECLDKKYFYNLQNQVECKDLQAVESDDLSIECQNSQLIIRSIKYPCLKQKSEESGEGFNPLYFIRLMPGHSIYYRENEDVFKHNQNFSKLILPNLKLSASGPFHFQEADWKDWSQESSLDKAYVQFQFVLEDSQLDPSKILLPFFSWISKEAKPKHLDWLPRLNFESKKISPTLFRMDYFYELKCPLKTSPYIELCSYIAEWLNARQVLEDIHANRKKKVVLKGLFLSPAHWNEGAAIILARLPIPWQNTKNRQFYFKSEDDFLSPTLFESLKKDLK